MLPLQVELDKGSRQNELKETEGVETANTSAYGAQNQASPMRHRLRSSGAMEGQVRGAKSMVRICGENTVRL